jgi:hypothetical protein
VLAILGHSARQEKSQAWEHVYWKLFPLTLFFYNISTILCGNNIVSCMGEEVMMEMTLS